MTGLENISVKPLVVREIDHGRSYVLTGVGFTAMVFWLHKGGWEARSNHGKMDCATKEDAFAFLQRLYTELILDQVIGPEAPT